MYFVNCLMFTSQGESLQVKIILQFYTHRRSKRKKADWQRNGHLPAPAPGSAMKALLEMSQNGVTRCTCGHFLAASTFLVVSGRRKYPLWLHKRLHSRLLALYLFVARRIGETNQILWLMLNLQQMMQEGRGRGGTPPYAVSHVHI